MNSDIVVIAELMEGRILPVTHEAIAFARALQAADPGPIRVIVPGNDLEVVRELAASAGVAVVALQGDQPADYSAEVWKAALTVLFMKRKPRYICIPHTSRGCDYAPALAVALKASCITAVDGFRKQDGGVIFSRAILNGKIRMNLASQAETAVLTILPGVYEREEKSPRPPFRKGGEKIFPITGDGSDANLPPDRRSGETCDEKSQKGADAILAGQCDKECVKSCDEQGNAISGEPKSPAWWESLSGIPTESVESIKVDVHPLRTRALGVIAVAEQDLDLSLADVIVSAGRGIGAEENLPLIRQLAGLFSKAAVGCSRAVCDRGWLGYKHQIGQTGKTVTPKLYLACGISGALQHLAGMRGSKFIVAVNKDPYASIFHVADVSVVEDLTVFLPLVIDRVKRCRQG